MSGYDIRRYEPSDESDVLDLMTRALGWRAEDPNAELFRWKHRDSPFGPSPAWVAVEAGRIIGFRTFMRWEFEEDGRIVRAVRAVDTATDPVHQGRGIFKRLTLHALDELREDGVAFVFNTPNDRSRPGYLKMGWHIAGRVPVYFRPRCRPGSMTRLLSARVPASLLSTVTSAGQDASLVLDDEGLPALLEQMPQRRGLATHLSADFLRWRYGMPALGYRAMLVGTSLARGLSLFRVRQRGRALEASVCEILVPDVQRARTLAAAVLGATDADYSLACTPVRGLAPLPGQGPLVTLRPLSSEEGRLFEVRNLSLGDAELF